MVAEIEQKGRITMAAVEYIEGHHRVPWKKQWKPTPDMLFNRWLRRERYDLLERVTADMHATGMEFGDLRDLFMWIPGAEELWGICLRNAMGFIRGLREAHICIRFSRDAR